MTLAAAARILVLPPILAACSGQPEANATAESELACSSVRSEHQEARQQLRRRVEQIRTADEAARKSGKPDMARDKEFQKLMAEIERAERRFEVRSKECVG